MRMFRSFAVLSVLIACASGRNSNVLVVAEKEGNYKSWAVAYSQYTKDNLIVIEGWLHHGSFRGHVRELPFTRIGLQPVLDYEVYYSPPEGICLEHNEILGESWCEKDWRPVLEAFVVLAMEKSALV